jgi:hypothetical protein
LNSASAGSLEGSTLHTSVRSIGMFFLLAFRLFLLLSFSLLSLFFRGYVFAFAPSFIAREFRFALFSFQVCCFHLEVSGFQALISRFLRSISRQDLSGLEGFWSAIPEGNCLLENQYCEKFLLSLGGSYFDHSIILSVCPLKSSFFLFPYCSRHSRTEFTRGGVHRIL